MCLIKTRETGKNTNADVDSFVFRKAENKARKRVFIFTACESDVYP